MLDRNPVFTPVTTPPIHTTHTPSPQNPIYRQPDAFPHLSALPRHGYQSSQMSASGRNNMAPFGGNVGSTGKGILIGILSAFGSAGIAVVVLAVFFFFRYTRRGRIILDRIGRPGEYDDEQAFAREEAEALESMDELQHAEYMRAKEIANCFVEARTEIEFFDSECSVQSNLPVPKQNEVYYWEAKIYDKPETSLISIGMTTKPYPLFRLPGFHKTSISYQSTGHRRYNQPFNPTPYGPEFVQGDVIGVGYRPRSGTVFFTRNGKKLDDVAHGLKSQNFFPTVGANGPCTVHVNFGQLGFVFIEANVKKWGLAPMTGSLAPPPPYGSEQGSILLETGRESAQTPQWWESSHSRSRSGTVRPGQGDPVRCPTDISLAPLQHVSSQQSAGEGTSGSSQMREGDDSDAVHASMTLDQPPPKYSSPTTTPPNGQPGDARIDIHPDPNDPPIPSYDAAVSSSPRPRQ
ncbi:conserved hypothetical protein [Uncinocarpus reesii 1704]|uniref:Protein SSH4 n=1 Tax=Uncinocarpus reesii (strain UAMH 1704) TaxID=336963 RepID=C4JY70_UNCRE|nr:uncharacterized protein UREG_07121 [Uncinocarpus reesii 1704]EEP82256.1 conserved hypothetical protein [Uncinocarpus reesii 1704]